MVSHLLTVDPKERLTADQALKHPWMLISDLSLSQRSLDHSLKDFKTFQAKRRFKKAAGIVMFAVRLQRMMSLQTQERSVGSTHNLMLEEEEEREFDEPIIPGEES